MIPSTYDTTTHQCALKSSCTFKTRINYLKAILILEEQPYKKAPAEWVLLLLFYFTFQSILLCIAKCLIRKYI